MISPAFLLCHLILTRKMQLPRGQLFRISLYYQRRDLVQHPRVKNVLSRAEKDFT